MAIKSRESEKSSEARDVTDDIQEDKAEKKEMSLEEKKNDFLELYELIRRHSTEGEILTRQELEEKSNRAEDLLREVEQILKLGEASAEAIESAMGAIIEQAQKATRKEDFWRGISDHSSMPSGSEIEKFYKSYIEGLSKQLKSKE